MNNNLHAVDSYKPIVAEIETEAISNNPEEKEESKTHQPIIQYETRTNKGDFYLDGKPAIVPPTSFPIGGNVAAMFMELQDKISATIISSTTKDIEQARDTTKAHREAILEKLDKQIDIKNKAGQESKAARVLSWIGTIFAVIFAVVATVFTAGGATPLLVGAAIAVGMTILQETGALDKLTEAIGKGISYICVKAGYSQEEADSIGQKAAMGIVCAAVLVATIASCCTGNVNVSGLTSTVARFAPKIAIMAQKFVSLGSKANNFQRAIKISTRAEMAGQGMLRSTEGGLNIDSGINQSEADKTQADYVQLTSLQKMIENIVRDNSEFVKNIISAQQEIFNSCIAIIKDMQDTSLKLVRQNNV